MSEEIPSYVRTNAIRIEDLIKKIPPREMARKERQFWEYRVLNHGMARVLMVEWYQDEYTLNQVPEGIRYFTPGFNSGFVTSDGEILNGSAGAQWRASIVELHGETKITTLQLNVEHYAAKMRKEEWGQFIASTRDESLRNRMIYMSLEEPRLASPTYLDFLEFAHEAHSRINCHVSFGEVSAIQLF